jgi:hypothetical protein
MDGISVAGKGIIPPDLGDMAALGAWPASDAAETGTHCDHIGILRVAQLNGHVRISFSGTGLSV